MSESAWLCRNRQCGLMFQWNLVTQVANYIIVLPECQEYPDGEEISMQVEVSGDAKPCGCPQCGGREIEPLEG